MRHTEGKLAARGGLELYWQAWLPEGEPKALVQLVHGIAEHSGRYAPVAELLVAAGLGVYADDHRGHGRSGGPRCHVERFSDYVDDERALRDLIAAGHPGKPIILYGHSMGSFIAARLVDREPGLYKALVLSATGDRLGGDVSPLLLAASKLLSVVAPRGMVKPTDLSQYISHDPVAVEAYRRDPLDFLDGLSFRLGAELMKVAKEQPEVVSRLRLPLFYFAGGEDRLVLGAREVAKRIASPDATVRIHEGLWHEVHNEAEPGRSAALAELRDWLLSRAG